MDELFNKSVFGYPMFFEKRSDQYIVTIDELGIREQSQSRGRAIRNVFENIKYKNKLNLIEPKKYDSFIEYHNTLQIRLFKVNQKITNFGFSVIAEDIKEIDMCRLEKICKNIDLNKVYGLAEMQSIENSIIEVLYPYIVNPHIRALNMISLIMETKYINKFSHLIEQAYISLFRGEYISTIMILTPAIEGILLSLYGFKFSVNKKPKEYQLLNKWAELQYDFSKEQLPHNFVIDEYIRAFIDIGEQTIFRKHQLAESNGYFNRNYIAHLMGDGRFYSRNNAFKLIHLIDLLVHVLAACNGQHNRDKFDINNKSYKLRERYYKSLLDNETSGIEGNIFKEHENFKGYV